MKLIKNGIGTAHTMYNAKPNGQPTNMVAQTAWVNISVRVMHIKGMGFLVLHKRNASTAYRVTLPILKYAISLTPRSLKENMKIKCTSKNSISQSRNIFFGVICDSTKLWNLGDIFKLAPPLHSTLFFIILYYGNINNSNIVQNTAAFL